LFYTYIGFKERGNKLILYINNQKRNKRYENQNQLCQESLEEVSGLEKERIEQCQT